MHASSPNFLVTIAKEMVFDPMFLSPETDALIQRILANEASKWEALRSLGLDRKGGKKK